MKIDDTALKKLDDTPLEKIEASVNIEPMPLVEGDEEEVKEGNGLKILTPNELLTRSPVLLAQIKAGINSYKLKNKIRKILSFLYQHNKF